MKRLPFILLLALAALPVCAQRSYHSRGVAFDVAVGAGYSRLGYAAVNPTANLMAKATGGFGYEGHLGVDVFFSEYVGLGIGADITRYADATALKGTLSWRDVTDTDGERYEHILHINGWKESQQITYVEPEVMLLASIPAGRVYVSAGVGVKYGWGIISSYKGAGELEHTGYYDEWNLTLSDMDAEGFYTETGFRPSGSLGVRNGSLFLQAKVGFLIPLVQGLDLQLHAIGSYGISRLNAVGSTDAVGFRDDRSGMQEAHYFMEDYRSLTVTEATSGYYRPLLVGLEAGIRYTIPFRKSRRKICMCEED